MYKIATWNLERPKNNTKKSQLAIAKIKEINADLLVLTESSHAIDLSELYPYVIHTLSYERTPNEQWVSIWCKWKIVKHIETFDNYRTVSGIIECPFGKISIFGTIIPYHYAGVSGERYGNLNYKTWEYHKKDLQAQSANWQRLLEHEKLPLMVIGDFNQTRFNNEGYGTKEVRAILTAILDKLDLNCVTAIDLSKKYLKPHPKTGKIRKNIDHICISNGLLKNIKNYEVGAWNEFTDNGLAMSDHNGVFITFEV